MHKIPAESCDCKNIKNTKFFLSTSFCVCLSELTVKLQSSIGVKEKNNYQLFNKFVMEAPKTSGEIEIHRVVFKGTLPARFRRAIDAINTQSRSFKLKGNRWCIGMII